MPSLYAVARPFFKMVQPETAHGLTLWALRKGLAGKAHIPAHPSLTQELWGRKFPNPVGLAAGFDKDAEAIAPLVDMGFGFVEAGTVTPQPQAGNPKPRIFRVPSHDAVINRMGFPSKGLENFRENVQRLREENPELPGMVGINIGKNKDTADAAEDYTAGIEKLAGLADYMVVNISSPNTPGLRDLQNPDELARLLDACLKARDKAVADNPPPMLVKLAPDLAPEQRRDIAPVLTASGIDGMVISNTTIERPADLPPGMTAQAGGLSGPPVRDRALEVLADMYRLTGHKLPIIGVGGISSAADAYARIRAGASLVQIYTALVYEGPSLVAGIVNGLAELLQADGLTHISQAVGAAAHDTPAEPQAAGAAG